MNFGDPIDGSGSLHSDVGTRVARRGETKGTNCARAEETNIVDLTHVYHIVEATDVHLQSQRGRWTERQINRWMDGRTDRQTDRDRQAGRQTDRQRERERDRQRQTDRHRQTDTDRQTDRQTYRQTGRQTDEINAYLFLLPCGVVLNVCILQDVILLLWQRSHK